MGENLDMNVLELSLKKLNYKYYERFIFHNTNL